MKEVYFSTGGANGVLTLCDSGVYCLEVGEEKLRFEFSEMWGPLVIGKRGQEIEQPGPNHNFWKAVSLWARQGRRVDASGLCVWRRLPALVCRKLGGRNVEVVSGELCDIWPMPTVWVD